MGRVSGGQRLWEGEATQQTEKNNPNNNKPTNPRRTSKPAISSVPADIGPKSSVRSTVSIGVTSSGAAWMARSVRSLTSSYAAIDRFCAACSHTSLNWLLAAKPDASKASTAASKYLRREAPMFLAISLLAIGNAARTAAAASSAPLSSVV